MSRPCDRCVATGGECPGQDEHCLGGLHCISTRIACAADQGLNDHPEACCACGFGLTRNQHGRRR